MVLTMRPEIYFMNKSHFLFQNPKFTLFFRVTVILRTLSMNVETEPPPSFKTIVYFGIKRFHSLFLFFEQIFCHDSLSFSETFVI